MRAACSGPTCPAAFRSPLRARARVRVLLQSTLERLGAVQTHLAWLGAGRRTRGPSTHSGDIVGSPFRTSASILRTTRRLSPLGLPPLLVLDLGICVLKRGLGPFVLLRLMGRLVVGRTCTAAKADPSWKHTLLGWRPRTPTSLSKAFPQFKLR